MAPDIKTPDNAEIDQALKEFEAKSNAGQISKAPEVLKTPETFNNSEIDQALKEFEAKSSIEQAQGASEIETSKASDIPRMVRLVLKLSGGAIKEQKQAEYVLFGVVIINIIIIIIVIAKFLL